MSDRAPNEADHDLTVLGEVLPDGVEPAGGAAAAPPAAGRLSLGGWSWSIFQGGRDPYVILITIYIFAPYFTTAVVGDPVKGQAMIATVSTLNSILIALTAPILGMAIDRYGARKPLMLAIVAAMAPMIFALWFSKPGGEGLPVMAGLWLFGIIGVLFAYCEVIHNSMLIRAAGHHHAPQASGLALSAGNFFSVITLTFCLLAFALPGNPAVAGWPLVPDQPLFGLDPSQAETSRVVAPIAAVLLVLFAIPLFLFTPDAPKSGVSFLSAFGKAAQHMGGVAWSIIAAAARGPAKLREVLGVLVTERDAVIYLGARMLFNDGMTALLIFSGIYTAGVMQWQILEMLAYGILLSIFAVAGGLCGAVFDNMFGPRNAVRIEITGSLICLIAWLGMGRDRILYFWSYDPAAHAPLWNGPMFRTLPEALYLLIGFGVAVFVTAQYASSRTLLTRLVPADKLPSFFGLYALSGTLTVWIGSMLVGLFTSLTQSQAGGFIPIAGLLALGLMGMMFVKGGGKQSV
ncbi:MAG: MFS transporter [Caulobacter sp.]|nr:MFS transporter [Caulobacter sp.]